MSTTTTVVLVAISSLSLVASSATLAIVLIGARKVRDNVEEMKKKSNQTISNLTFALENLKF